ncbi:MAG: isocitrate/isopropylmalate dehydrogenase family protein, partial [Candidatus Methanomethylophilaceae archaeon]|nr:isocitrate/isopropylmalate dehydrogenase family protein [Candidatus Methanomethylophilaceae archaeon]
MVDEKAIQMAQEKFGALVRKQLERVEVLKNEGDWVDYSKLDKLIIGVCGGDGIGPYICASAQKVMEVLLADKIAAGKVEIRQIDGLTIERRVEVMKAIPDDTLEELKKCHVILKGPTTTPAKGDPWPNIESANVAMRKELDLFANVRPVSVPELGIDWTFYRENTEGSYALGSDGFFVSDDLAMDFCVATTQGTERIIRAGFEHAKKTGTNYVSIIVKANIIKTTDGLFVDLADKIAEDYPGVKHDVWFVDITTAKLIDPA